MTARVDLRKYPIPEMANLSMAISGLILTILIWTIPIYFSGSIWILCLSAFFFALIYQPLYALLHECMHSIFSANKLRNDVFGFLIAFFLPTSFGLVRYFHLGHHRKNRGDHELIEYAFPSQNRVWRTIRYYAILMGLNWFGLVVVNFIFSMLPIRVIRHFKLDRLYGSSLPKLSDSELRAISIEHLLIVVGHATILLFTPVTGLQYLAFFSMSAFAFSQIRYVYHFRSELNVVEGAYDLQAPKWLTLFLLNGSYHLAHHRVPSLPWIHLRKISSKEDARYGFFEMLGSQWKGVTAAPPAAISRREISSRGAR